MDGALPEEEEYDLSRIMNGRLTSNEYAKASAAKHNAYYDQCDYDIESDGVEKLDEALWCLLNDHLEGTEVWGKLKSLREGDGLAAYQHIHVVFGGYMCNFGRQEELGYAS